MVTRSRAAILSAALIVLGVAISGCEKVPLLAPAGSTLVVEVGSGVSDAGDARAGEQRADSCQVG